MIIARLSQVQKYYGAELILEDVSWSIDRDRKVGVVGRNGAGKTTLFRLLLGQTEPDKGDVWIDPGMTIRCLEQNPALDESVSVLDLASEPLSHLEELRAREAGIHGLMAAPGFREEAPEGRRLLKELGEIHERLHHLDAYTAGARVESVLMGLGFTEADFPRPVGELSGGQRARVRLAQLLVDQPDLLLLDEPTNHLDLDALEWLEEFLRTYQGGVAVVCHDRWFLDRVADEIADVDRHKLTVYAGNYTAYASAKAERLDMERKAYELQKAEIERQEEFIRRNIAGQKTKQAQSRRKKLEKIERLEAPPGEGRAIRIALEPERQSGWDVVRLQRAGMRYGERRVLSETMVHVVRGQRLGVIGPNGSGKTTLLKLMAGQLEPTEGDVRVGTNVEIGYYDQEHRNLDVTKNPFEQILEERPTLSHEQARTFLGRFLFSGDDVFKPLSSLSGGERSRISLARLMLRGPNLLLLDEPTNHLDIASRAALEEALLEYEGTIVAVSHDRYFLDRVAQKTLLVRDARVRIYEGGYTYFQRKTAEERASQRAAAEQAAAREAARRAAAEEAVKRSKKDGKGAAAAGGRSGGTASRAAAPSRPPARAGEAGVVARETYEQKKAMKRARQQAERVEIRRKELIQTVEAEILGLDEQLENLTMLMEDAGDDAAKLLTLSRQYEELAGKKADLYRRWEELIAG